VSIPPSSISPSDVPDSPEVAALKKLLADRDRELAWEKLRVQVLEARLRKLLLAKYGPSSEKLSDDQLRLLELEPGVSNEEVERESARSQDELEHRPKRERKAKPHPGRQTLPEDLPRVEEIVEVPAAQCVCGSCQQEMPVIGYEENEQLDVKPAEYYVRVTKREKRACSTCGKGGVKTAPLMPSIIDKSLVSNRIVLDTVMAKYLDHRVPRTWRQQCRHGAVKEMRGGPSKPEIRIRLQTTASCCR
jgi:transposase